ncbi:4-hydroxybenzoate polyprenyltransferase/phosphoglycolate phosphatase-like HAD superfamily hydrolase [Novosphingobium fluoreni]|uniref:4-hydroxybenzoate polyprenyltransferase/phosphoglycolate phosphatase-like HAD superfamily hydrolase n=1 Tax=Novosphingobium fluoreni TaxID=1391222 RepID=A0A7W6C4S5_9SPHN|nr:4-hydroxybenzoate polyprenyltransferase/phosphoglycolate phosphatase-like HAD superfamily hydrolase [Novosphingobium fluoreni]
MTLAEIAIPLVKGGSSRTLPLVLAVDLDGTLLRSNMLHETFWSAFAHDWRVPFAAAAHLGRGKAQLKAMLAQRSNVDVTVLPYDDEVIAYIRDWRAQGGKVALVTATDQRLADRIGAHLGLFDEVFGSDGVRNLKGPNKAAFLVERYGQGNYAYVGDTHADDAVWRNSGHAVVKSRSGRVRARAEAHTSFHAIQPPAGSAKGLLKALRPHQWAKNVLVFLAIAGAHKLLDPDLLLRTLGAFVAFSLVASSVYLVNDLLDLSADRAHARKRKRPFASGAAAIELGLPVTVLLLLAGFAIAALLGPLFLLTLGIYFITTTAYSLSLKRYPIIDICVLAGLYTIRVVAGGVATGLPISVWLAAFSLFIFFSLAAVKRQAELVDAVKAGKLQIVGRGYHPDDLELVSQMGTASGLVSVLVITLYLSSDAVTEIYTRPEALWGVTPVLLFWISRVIFKAHRGEMHDDPIVFAAKDKVSMICGVLMFGFVMAATIP